MHAASTSLTILEVLRTALRFPAHFIPLPSFFDNLDAIEILNCDELLPEVVCSKIIVRVKAEDLLLLELFHEDLLHLPMSEFAIIIEAQSLDSAIFVFIKLNFVLEYLDSSFEDTFILDSLSDFDSSSVCFGAFRRVLSCDLS